MQRGCSYYCTFCIVPHVRGRFDHRPPNAILDETRERIAQGAREIVLVGQTVNAWNDPASGDDFGDLCRSIAALPGLERLGFISPHPKDFTEKILDDLCSLEQLNPRIHLPLQSGSDALLRRMNRKYTLAQFDGIVQSIRRRLPECAITTDLIVGFPGETASDFQATLDYVRSGVFANAFSFIYSIRRGTPAARWAQVPQSACARALCGASRSAERGNARLPRLPRRTNRARFDRWRLEERRQPADREGARQRDRRRAETPADYPYPQTPWLDVAIETAHVWGCTGTVVRRAARFADAGMPVMRPAARSDCFGVTRASLRLRARFNPGARCSVPAMALLRACRPATARRAR